MEKKKKFRLPLSVYLIYLLFILFLFSFTTFSSYVTSTENSVTGRSAMFQLIVDSQSKNLIIDVNEGILTDKYDFSVKSNSEVTTYYDIIVDLKTELPPELTISLDTKQADKIEDNVYTFNNVGSFTPLDNSIHNHSLIFTATEDLSGDVELSDLQIKVLMSQKD